MQVETDGCINENLRDCEKLDSSEYSNMCDNNSRQNPTRNQKEACMLAQKNLLVLHSKYFNILT